MPETLLQWVLSHGIAGVAVVAFLAATVLPFSSEAAVVGALALTLDPTEILVAASVGNCLGALSNYVIGIALNKPALLRLKRSQTGLRAINWTTKYGHWSLLGSFLPVVGDPILLAAGVFKIKLRWVITFGLGTRVARYVAIVGALT